MKLFRNISKKKCHGNFKLTLSLRRVLRFCLSLIISLIYVYIVFSYFFSYCIIFYTAAPKKRRKSMRGVSTRTKKRGKEEKIA